MSGDTLGGLAPALGFTVAGALFWVMYLDVKDALRPEPRRMLLAAVALGCLASAVAFAAYRLLEAAGVGFPYGGGTAAVAAFCFAVIGPVEEGAKFLVTRFVLLRSRHFDEHLDGLVYPCAVAIGFAGAESLLLAGDAPLLEQAARAAVGPAVHSVFAMVWGFGLAHAHFSARTPAARWLWQALPLLAAMLLHGLYDFALLGLGLTWAASALFAVLWLTMVLAARRALALDRAAGGGPWR